MAIGVYVATRRPLGQDIDRETRRLKSRTEWRGAFSDEEAPPIPSWKLLASGCLRFGAALAWSVFLPAFLRAQKAAAEAVLGTDRQLRFSSMGGEGQLSCMDCDHGKKVTSFLRGFGVTEWTSHSARQFNDYASLYSAEISRESRQIQLEVTK